MITVSANESEAPLTSRVASIPSRAAAAPTALGVFVVGMHRSGTSATTRILNLLGLPLCRDDDLVQDSVGNPSGHWESASLVQFNDRLLWTIGASWWCPQRPNATWVGEPLVAPALRAAPTIFAAGHAGPQWAWKDPRTSLTLPFWLTALDVKPLVVLCTRNPLEVTHSLRTRNAMGKPLSLALWERYTHTILNAIDGLPVLVTHYEDLMRDPIALAERTHSFLVDHGALLHADVDEAAVAAFIDPELRHTAFDDEDVERSLDVTENQRALHRALRELPPASEPFRWQKDVVESPATDALFARVRRNYGLVVRHGDAGRRSRSREVRRRSATVSVVVVTRNEGDRLRLTIERIADTIPRSAEIVVVDDGSTDDSTATVHRLHPGLRVVDRHERLGVAAARNLGASAASGDLLVFSDAHVAPDEGWQERLAEVASRPEAGAIAPAITTRSRNGAVGHGLTFVDSALNIAWLRRPDTEPFPVPLVCGCFFAVRRRVFLLAGAFDRGFAQYGCEDLEFSLRLWRLGFECMVDPRATVAHRFRAHEFDDAGREDCLYNLLRLGTIHFGRDELRALTRTLRPNDRFAPALARVLGSDAGERRASLARRCAYDANWFFRRFEIDVLGS